MSSAAPSWSVWALLMALSAVAALDGLQIGTPKPSPQTGGKQVATRANATGARELSIESLLSKLKLPSGEPKSQGAKGQEVKKALHEELLGAVLGKKGATKGAEDSFSTAQLVTRLGFKYELHYCNSPDGYTTQLVRLVNPHSSKSHLREVPVVLYAGQGTSPAAFLVGSLEEANTKANRSSSWRAGSYEEQSDDQLVGDLSEQVATSRGNGSLAVLLSESGFDVWLVPARGVDAQNRARNSSSSGNKSCGDGSQSEANTTKAKGLFKRSLDGKEIKLMKKLEDAKQLMIDIKEKNKPKFGVQDKPLPDLGSIDLSDMKLDLLEKLRELLKSFAAKSYWSFSNDEIIEREFQCQLELVRSVSGAKRVSLVSYSNGGFITFGLMSRQPAWVRQHLDVVIALAPAVFVNKFNVALNLAGFASQASLFDAPFPEDQLGALGKKLCLQEPIRSSACKALIEQLYGPSELFAAEGNGGLSASELNCALEHHLVRPLSAQALRQVLQVAHAGRLQQYDQGLLGNVIAYKQDKPPAYELDQVNHERLFVVSGERDAFVDKSSLLLLMGSIGCKPKEWLRKKHYSHLDVLLGRDVDREVNMPVTNILIDRDIQLNYYSEKDEREEEARWEQESHDRTSQQAHEHRSESHESEQSHYQMGAEHGSEEPEYGQPGSEESPVYASAHTTSHLEGKSYDVEGHGREEPQVEQSAQWPVKVAAVVKSNNSETRDGAAKTPTQQSDASPLRAQP